MIFVLAGTAIITIAGLVGLTDGKKSKNSEPEIARSYDATLTGKNISCYAASVKDSPQNAIGYNLLAQAYLLRSRETGDIGDAERAMLSAQHSLAIRTNNNQAAAYTLAQTYLVQHRFREALQILQKFGMISPGSSAACLSVEILIELGEYDRAREFLRKYVDNFDSIPAKTTRARLAELEGRTASAIALIRSVQQKTDQNLDMSNESVAWFHLREGDLLALSGDPENSKKAYLAALSIFPNNFKALSGLAKLASSHENWDDAIKWAAMSISIVPNPEIVALLGDAYKAKNMNREAESQYRLLESMAQISRSQGVLFDRQRSVYLSDHKLNLSEAISLARKELKVRKDIYAYDTLAWALYQNGSIKEASTMMKNALKEGTEDARLFYHASLIARAMGEEDSAKLFFKSAQNLNPHLKPFAAKEANRLLNQNKI